MISGLYQKLGSVGFVQNVLKIAGATSLAQALYLFISPILTRIYTPDDFGVYGILMGFVGIGGAVVALRYETALISASDDLEADDLLIGSVILGFVLSGLLSLVLWAMISFGLFSFGELPVWAALGAFFLLFALGSQTVLRNMLLRKDEYGTVGRVVVAQGVGRSLMSVIGGLALIGWSGLYLGELSGRLAGLRVQWGIFLATLREWRGPGCWASLVNTGRKYWKYPIVSVPSTLVNSIATWLPVLLVPFFYGAEAAGYFFFVQRIAAAPAGLIGTSVADVFQSQAAKRVNEIGALRGLFLRTAKYLFGISSVPTVLAMALAPIVFPWLFGEDWRTTGILLTILGPMTLAGLVVSPLSRVLLVVHKPEWKVFYDVSSLAAAVIPLWFGSYLGWEFLTSMLWFSAAQTLAFLLYYFLCLGVVNRHESSTRIY